MNLQRQKQFCIHEKYTVDENGYNNTYDSVELEVSYKGQRKEENKKGQKAKKTNLSKPGGNQIQKRYETFCLRSSVDVGETCYEG